MENSLTPLTTPSPKSSTKSEQIAHLVRQCFAIQDTYGKKPEELKILMMAMIEDLAEHDIGAINTAFKVWRRTKSKIPTPAEILELLPKPKQTWQFIEDPRGDHWHGGKRWRKEPVKK